MAQSNEEEKRDQARMKAAEKIASLMKLSSKEEDDAASENGGCFGFKKSRKRTNSNKTNNNNQPPPSPPKRFFGASLADVFGDEKLLSTSSNGVRCPQVVYHCVEYLRTVITLEGLFRVSGTWGEINKLKASYEAGETPDLAKVDNPHSVSSLLDAYLRQLPDPLLTAKLYDEFIKCGSIPDIPERIKAVVEVTHQLPEPHYATLKVLLPFFKEITLQVAKNKMDARNLGLIFGPILMGGDEALSLLQIGKIKTQANLVELMITNCEVLVSKGENSSEPTNDDKIVEMPIENGHQSDDDSTSSSAED